jgi:hypothetical protein
MTSRYSMIRVAMLLCGVALFAACGDVGEKIVKYSDKGTRNIERLKEAQAIDTEDADRILPLIGDVRAVGVEYAALEQAIKQARSEGEKQILREQLRILTPQVIASLSRLESEGVLKIKNEATRQRVRKYFVFAEIIADLAT